MGRASMRVSLRQHGVGPARHEPAQGPARPIVRYVGRGPTTVKKFYFQPIPARARIYGPWAGPRAEFPFFCFLV